MTHFTTDIHILDPVDNRNNGYDRNLESKYAMYPRKMNEFPGLRSYHSFAGTDTDTMLQNEPDIASPRLWKPGSQSKTFKSVSFSHSNDCYSPPMSPSSRTQAIARGRKEMMDMVRDLPESFYELSLKDIVEKQPEMDAPKETNKVNLHEGRKTVVEMAKVNETKQKMSGKRVEKKEKNNRKIGRSQSIEKEKFLLKTSVIFPVFLGSKKKKKGKGGSGSGNGSGRFRITPMPKQEAMRRGSSKGVEKDWWKKRSCKSSESDDSSGLSNSGSSRSSSVSSRSSNSSGRHKNGLLPSFCFFIGRKIKGRKHTHA